MDIIDTGINIGLLSGFFITFPMSISLWLGQMSIPEYLGVIIFFFLSGSVIGSILALIFKLITGHL